jgi:hypothetical protein
MEEYINKGRAWRSLLRWICFGAFGITAFSNPLDRWDPAYIGFGAAAGLLFGYIFRKFLRGFLSLFNGSLKKEMGREAIAYAVDSGMLFLCPFAAMSLLSVYCLKWSVTVVFVSAGVMAVGTASALEIGKLKGVQEIKNTIATAFVSYLLSFVWTLSAQWLARTPLYIEGGVNLLRSVLGKGGGSL